MTTVIAYPFPTAKWNRIVTNSSVIPVNEFTSNVRAYVNISGEESYGNYFLVMDNGLERNLVLKFVIQPEEGNVFSQIIV